MKLRKLQSQLRKKGIDLALFLTPDPNLTYFTQIEDLSFACLIVPAYKNPVLLTSLMDYERSEKEFSAVQEIIPIKNIITLKRKKLSEFLPEFLKKNKIKHSNIGINKPHMSIYAFSFIKKAVKGKYHDIYPICSELRSTKTKKEIQHIKKACHITNQVMREVLDRFNEFKTETQVEAELNYLAKRLFADRSFKTIVASGKNASMPHHTTKNRPLQKGFCLIDFGVKYKGYCSDITRTVFIGKPSSKQQRIYDFLLNIQEKTIKKSIPGTTADELYEYVVKNLKQYKDNFIHGLGHGFGIEIHESPNLSKASKDILKENMIFTIEPGIYFPNKFGIRIEDDILIQNGKPKVLTTVGKGLRRV